MQGVGALVYGLGADEPTCTPLATPLTEIHSTVTMRTTWASPSWFTIVTVLCISPMLYL